MSNATLLGTFHLCIDLWNFGFFADQDSRQRIDEQFFLDEYCCH